MVKNITLILLIIITLTAKGQNNKFDITMEPKILLVGRNLDVMEILKNELKKSDRKVVYANSKDLIKQRLEEAKIDLIVMGAGLPDETRKEMGAFIKELSPDTPLFIIERTQDSSPYKMIDFTNEKAVLWKLEKVLGPMPSQN
jgi:DNA-binding NtrC family response regulator